MNQRGVIEVTVVAVVLAGSLLGLAHYAQHVNWGPAQYHEGQCEVSEQVDALGRCIATTTSRP